MAYYEQISRRAGQRKESRLGIGGASTSTAGDHEESLYAGSETRRVRGSHAGTAA